MPELDLSKRTNSGRGTVHTLTELLQIGKIHERSDLVPRPTPEVGPRTTKLRRPIKRNEAQNLKAEKA